jgi:putative DNA primase/helicase
MYELSSTNHHQNAVETTYQEEVNNSNSQADAVINSSEKPNPEVHQGFDPQQQPKSRLNDKHYFECVTKRGLNPEWIEINCRSMTIFEASDRLGYPAKSEGIWLEGVNGFGQFRPNKPWKNGKEATGIPTVGNGSGKRSRSVSEGLSYPAGNRNGTGSTESANVPESISSRQLSEKKAPKYRTATGEEYDAMLPRHPHNPRYWEDLVALQELCWKINGHPCLGITEGMLKAISGCANNIPCVALAGVEMGLTPAKNDPQGKRYLVETLEKLARAGFGFIIIFDADAAIKEGVIQAQRKLAAQLVKFKVPVYIATGLWSEDQGKGMDDYIQNNGIDKFKREIMGKIIDLGVWEKQFQKHEGKDKQLTQTAFARQIANKYSARLAWNVPAKAWYWYEVERICQTEDYFLTNSQQTSNREDSQKTSHKKDSQQNNHKEDSVPFSGVNSQKEVGVWSEISHEHAFDTVVRELELHNREATANFVNGVLTILKGKLRVDYWQVMPGWVCLEDCIVNIRTLKTREHEPGFRFLSRLPFKWCDREVGCEPIKQWLLETCGNNSEWLEVIRAAMNATITERGGELQRYTELIGAGGTGKGTILRLVQMLLGKDNYAVTTLKEVEQNRFESAKFYGKKAIFITDSERYVGDVSRLKALTGNDEIPIEKKGVQQTGSYKFLGLVWVAANEAMQSSDYTNGLSRRRLSMSFERVIPPHQRRDLMDEFKPYLPGLLFWVLSMEASEVADYVRNTTNRVPSLRAFSTEVLLETNPLANWADQHLYYDPNIETKIGDATGDASYCLYANYAQWASANGQGTMTTQRFSSNLINLLKTQLGIDATKRKTNKGRFISCIGIRAPGNNFPLLISGESEAAQSTLREAAPRLWESSPAVTAEPQSGDDIKSKSDDPVTTRVTTGVMTETIDSYDTQQSDDLFNSFYSNQSATNTTCLNNMEVTEAGKGGLQGSTPSPVSDLGRHQAGMVPSQNQSQVVTNQPETVISANTKNNEALDSDETQVFLVQSQPNCESVVTSQVKNAETLDSDETQPINAVKQHSSPQVVTTQVKNSVTLDGDETQSISQQIFANWNNMLVLGQLILAIADTEILFEAVRNLTPDQIKHIKDAAKQAWKPGCSSYGEYCGEKVELMEFGNNRNWKVRSANGSLMPAARGNVRPWLGI